MTAAPLNGVPSVNLTPFFKLKVYVLASGEMSHFSARPGTNLPGSGSHTSGSQMLSVTRMLRVEIGDLWIERIVEVAVQPVHQRAA